MTANIASTPGLSYIALGNWTVRISTPLRTNLMRFTLNVVNLPFSLQKNLTLDKVVELNPNSSKQQFSNIILIESNVTTISSENQRAHKYMLYDPITSYSDCFDSFRSL